MASFARIPYNLTSPILVNPKFGTKDVQYLVDSKLDLYTLKVGGNIDVRMVTDTVGWIGTVRRKAKAPVTFWDLNGFACSWLHCTKTQHSVVVELFLVFGDSICAGNEYSQRNVEMHTVKNFFVATILAGFSKKQARATVVTSPGPTAIPSRQSWVDDAFCAFVFADEYNDSHVNKVTPFKSRAWPFMYGWFSRWPQYAAVRKYATEC